MEYKNIMSNPFKWLFIDPETLSNKADFHGFKTETLYNGPNHDYLARLTIKN